MDLQLLLAQVSPMDHLQAQDQAKDHPVTALIQVIPVLHQETLV